MEETKDKDVIDEVQLVAFILENEEFAVNIQQVREVLKIARITPLPRSIDFIEGVINLRGEIIPVIDLCKRFGLDRNDKRDESGRIIIVEIEDNEVGLIVDAVTEVIRLSQDSIQLPPANVAGTRTDLIQGIGKMDERLIIILNLDKILTTEEHIAFENLTLPEADSQ
ncbi:MAG: chemotaxis protein CheW [Dethiobacteria bacterium]